MIHQIHKSHFSGHGPIKILYPGKVLSRPDTGIGSIGRIDHAVFNGSTLIPMHPHVNDEILTYLRSGSAEHKDSEGYTEIIRNNKLMLMKAGHLFYHEEKVFGDAGTLEGLQIFIRPARKNLVPSVTFLDLENAVSPNIWRLLASPDAENALQFSSKTWVFDIMANAGTELNLPFLSSDKLTVLLYVFNGKISVNHQFILSKMEGLVMNDEHPIIEPLEDSEMVLFVTDESAEIFKGGMYSGNQF